jgi:hypothetical protein
LLGCGGGSGGVGIRISSTKSRQRICLEEEIYLTTPLLSSTHRLKIAISMTLSIQKAHEMFAEIVCLTITTTTTTIIIIICLSVLSV